MVTTQKRPTPKEALYAKIPAPLMDKVRQKMLHDDRTMAATIARILDEYFSEEEC